MTIKQMHNCMRSGILLVKSSMMLSALTSPRGCHDVNMQRNNTNKRCKSIEGKQTWIRLVTQNHGSNTRSNVRFAAV